MTDNRIIMALSAIRDFAYGEAYANPNNITDEYELLWDTFQFANDEATIISGLYFGECDTLTLKKAKCLVDKDIRRELSNLADRNAVEPVRDSWRLTDDTREAIRKGEPIPPKPFGDCYEALRSARTYSITETWLQSFNRGLLLPGNERMRAASDELGVASLPLKGQMAFWALAREFLANGSGGMVRDDDFDLGLLAKAGLSVLVPARDETETNRHVLSPRAAGALFQGREEAVRYDEISKAAQVILAKDIARKDLFYPSGTNEDIGTLRTLVSQEGYMRAKKVLSEMNRPASVQVLLWGPPGTGKTEAARQLARESGRDLLVVDTARLTGQYMGQSEKGWRSLFLAYNSIAMVSGKVPILLLNEADSILSKRVRVERTIDKAENGITDIILQELESMTGILIATTNDTDSIDDAFDRRFLFKVEIGPPDAQARERIWSADIPKLSREEAALLAGEFRMTGAQIHNVAVKRNIAAIYYDGDRGLEYIKRLCERELALERKKRGHCRKIGFQV